MNQFFLYWVDLTALLLSLALGVVLAIKATKKSAFSIRPVAAFFLFLGPAAIVVYMSFHLIENIYRAVVFAAAGIFAYNFRFYSLMLMGVVISYLSVEYLQRAFSKCLKRQFKSKELLITMGKIVLVSVPTVPLTPIGALPTMACIISLTGLPFIYKNKRLLQNMGNEAPNSPLVVEQII